MIVFLRLVSAALILASAFGGTRVGAVGLPDDPQGVALLQEAQKAITAYHAGAPKSEAKLRVVYFCPNDRDPLPDYAERLDRTMTDVSDFYRAGLQRLGVASAGLPLERKDGRLVLHLVKGKKPAKGYSYESGDETAAEIRAALRGELDLEREHVLVIYALCHKEADGRYVFGAPYYGLGTQRGGICHAADCELLDPKLLTETTKKIVYTEHYHPRMVQTWAEFNSWYLGGVAHELGHGLGLWHDSGGRGETPGGTSLMGTGNLNYRHEVWGGPSPAYLSRESALKFVSHPFVTGSDRGRWDDLGGGVSGVTFAGERGALLIRGKAAGTIPPYAVVAYVWPMNKTDHGATTFPVLVRDGGFEIRAGGLAPGVYRMGIETLHVNGGATWSGYRFGFDGEGNPATPVKLTSSGAGRLDEAWAVQAAENAVMERGPKAGRLVSDQAIASAPSDEEGRMLRVLREVSEPPTPTDLGTVMGATASLSDARWVEAKVGWGQVARNHYWFDEKIQNGVFLLLAGKFYDKGLYAHSPSRYVFELDGKWKEFTAKVGLRDGATKEGSAVFVVRGDGRELCRSAILRAGGQAALKADVTGVKKIELTTEGGEGHTHNSWAIWVEPRVRR